MYLLLIFLWFKSGMVEARTSLVYDIYSDTRMTCEEALPLTEKLYREGKFYDGPKPELIRKVTGRCEKVEEVTKLSKNGL